MNSEVVVETSQLKASIKRNSIGKFILTSVVVGTVTVFVVNGMLSCMIGIYILIGYILLSEFSNYWIMLSVLTDRALFAIRKRVKS